MLRSLQFLREAIKKATDLRRKRTLPKWFYKAVTSSPPLSPSRMIKALGRSGAVTRMWRSGGWVVFQLKEGYEEEFPLYVQEIGRIKGIKVCVGYTLLGRPIIKVWMGQRK